MLRQATITNGGTTEGQLDVAGFWLHAQVSVLSRISHAVEMPGFTFVTLHCLLHSMVLLELSGPSQPYQAITGSRESSTTGWQLLDAIFRGKRMGRAVCAVATT